MKTRNNTKQRAQACQPISTRPTSTVPNNEEWNSNVTALESDTSQASGTHFFLFIFFTNVYLQ
jgi:hypothetical protein